MLAKDVKVGQIVRVHVYSSSFFSSFDDKECIIIDMLDNGERIKVKRVGSSEWDTDWGACEDVDLLIDIQEEDEKPDISCNFVVGDILLDVRPNEPLNFIPQGERVDTIQSKLARIKQLVAEIEHALY